MFHATISLDNVSKQFDHTLLFDHVSLTFHQGTSYALQGISGTGKSTFLSLVGKLDVPTSGTIMHNFDPRHILPIAHLFQQPYLIKELSVIENIQITGLLNRQNKKACDQRSHILLEKIALSDKAHAYPCHLSGGESQRVALARALFYEPLFLIADEPTASLDYRTTQEIIQLLQHLQKEWNMGLIIATHDKVVADMLDERYLFSDQTLKKKS